MVNKGKGGPFKGGSGKGGGSGGKDSGKSGKESKGVSKGGVVKSKKPQKRIKLVDYSFTSDEDSQDSQSSQNSSTSGNNEQSQSNVEQYPGEFAAFVAEMEIENNGESNEQSQSNQEQYPGEFADFVAEMESENGESKGEDNQNREQYPGEWMEMMEAMEQDDDWHREQFHNAQSSLRQMINSTPSPAHYSTVLPVPQTGGLHSAMQSVPSTSAPAQFSAHRSPNVRPISNQHSASTSAQQPISNDHQYCASGGHPSSGDHHIKGNLRISPFYED